MKTRNLNISALCAVALVFGAFSFANAGTVNHGMVMGPNVAYIDIQETSADPVPLYGAPIVVGDSLAFFEPSSPNPSLGFSAQTNGGFSDFTDGFLNLTIMSKNDTPIQSITFSEGGDYRMSALGDALAQVSATLNVFQLNVIEVNGAPVTPIALGGGIDSTTLDLPGDPAAGVWSLSQTFDISQLAPGATKLTARINNTLTALSQPGSVAGIFKKDFDVEVVVPEPTSLALAAFGLLGVLATRRNA